MTRSYLLSTSAAVALLLAGAATANAADIVMPEPEPMLYDWSGIYIGGHAGGGVLGTEGRYSTSEADSAIDLGALGGEIGGVFGGQVGWNFQAGNIVFSVEGDITAIGGLDNFAWEAVEQDPDTSGINLDNDFLASVRGRIGWADDNVLFYVTGGVAWYEGELKLNEEKCEGSDECKLDVSETGGVAGAGIEWGVTENVTLRAEGLYYFFDDKHDLEDHLTDATEGDTFTLDDALVARVGFNIKFNPFN